MKFRILIATILFATAASAEENSFELPPSPKRPVLQEYHGVKVSDPYQWLEETNNSQVIQWTDAENAYARNFLEHLPSQSEIKAKLQKWNDFKTPGYKFVVYQRGTYFALKLQPPKNQAILVAMSSVTDLSSEHAVLDPNSIDTSGTTAIDFFKPSLDGKFVAVSLSKGGSEEGTLHIYESSTGKEMSEQIPRVNKATAGGDVAWNQDGSGFYYTRYPVAGERSVADLDFFQQIYFHKIGTSPDKDQYSLGKGFPRIAEVKLDTSPDGKAILATVANGDGGEFAHYVLGASNKWTQVTRFKDKVTAGTLGLHDDLYLISLSGTPRGKLLRVSLSQPKLSQAKVVVKQSPGVIKEVLPTQTRLYVNYLVGGPSEIRTFDLKGKSLGNLPAASLSSLSDLEWIAGDQIIYKTQSFVQPVNWYTYENSEPQKTALITQSPVDFSDIEVKRELARSKDGTVVPITLLYRKGVKQDGKNPALLYAYGGYSISLTPKFNPDLHLWLEQGGVYAIANLRGGGEFGEDWHRAGNLTQKQNVFDDFIACAEHLIGEKYTNRNRLAIEGGSNGGLLMGAALTQRPDLFHVVVSHVGIYDMLRVELDPNGAFNVTEFGTVKDTAQFKALYAYSPYHHVVDRTAYPSVLLLTGANDGRVNPYHSKKMTARLQAATSSGKPILLRVTFDGGHGMGRSVAQKVAEEADVYAFLFSQLGMSNSGLDGALSESSN